VLEFLSRSSPPGTRFPDLHIPDPHCVLVPAARTYFNDSPWLAARVMAKGKKGGPSLTAHIHIAHAALSLDLCGSLGVQPLSRCIQEALEPSAVLAPVPPDEAGAAGSFGVLATAALKSPGLAQAIARIVVSQHTATTAALPTAAVSGAHGGSVHGDGEASSGVVVPSASGSGSASGSAARPLAAPALAPILLRILSGVTVQVVQEVPVRLSVDGVVFCTHQPSWFVDGSSVGRRILLARSLGVPHGDSSLGLVSALGSAVCRVLETHVANSSAGPSGGAVESVPGPTASIRVPDTLPVVLALSTAMDAVRAKTSDLEPLEAVLSTLRVGGGGGGRSLDPSPDDPVAEGDLDQEEAYVRGVPGSPLTPGDVQAARLAPLRMFEVGEVVAWSATASTRDLRYGWSVPVCVRLSPSP
jgi:hypothetical protein